MTDAPRILNAQGHPARTPASECCPQCGASTAKRTASSGFGVAHPVCSVCGYEWHEEVWRE